MWFPVLVWCNGAQKVVIFVYSYCFFRPLEQGISRTCIIKCQERLPHSSRAQVWNAFKTSAITAKQLGKTHTVKRNSLSDKHLDFSIKIEGGLITAKLNLISGNFLPTYNNLKQTESCLNEIQLPRATQWHCVMEPASVAERWTFNNALFKLNASEGPIKFLTNF